MKRYDLREYVNSGTRMAESATGDYVAYSDVVELAKRWGIPQHILDGGDPTYAKTPIHANGICDHMKPVNECTICHLPLGGVR